MPYPGGTAGCNGSAAFYCLIRKLNPCTSGFAFDSGLPLVGLLNSPIKAQ